MVTVLRAVRGYQGGCNTASTRPNLWTNEFVIRSEFARNTLRNNGLILPIDWCFDKLIALIEASSSPTGPSHINIRVLLQVLQG